VKHRRGDVAAAVLFDIDGTLVDSNYHHVYAWCRAFADVGIAVDAWRIHRSIGKDGGELLESLLDGGCRYLVCGGDDCEWWHDVADELFVAKYLNSSGAKREDNHVMTTWHANEAPEDVAFFFVFNTNFDDITFSRFLVLNLGSEAELSVVDARVQEQARTLAR